MRFASYRSGRRSLVHPEPLTHCAPHQLSPFTAISRLDDFDNCPLDPTYAYSIRLQNFLQGKFLLISECPFSLKLLHDHYLHGYVHYHKAIVQKNRMYVCKRCGNREQRLFATFDCARCLDSCVYCRKCIRMGRVSECIVLLSWAGPVFPAKKYAQPLKWKSDLTREQEKASRAVIAAVENKRNLLIWAVCGAGKTEILFEGLNKAFSLGLRVCLATPRVDVVKEILPRIKEVFPTVTIRSLYGESRDDDEDVALVLSTTHQLLRSRNRFDVMIIDEVDAFPYSIDPMLRYAVTRATKERSTLIYVTATPNDELKRQLVRGQLQYVKIPIRYHGHLLPVPRLKWCGNWTKRLRKEKLPSIVTKWVREQMEARRQTLLFVPSVEVMEAVERLLCSQYSDVVASVHADDPFRSQKVDDFRNRKTRLLVTTTILERGVTIPALDVAVFGSEAAIFTEEALVQIAGRVGRSAEFPTGDVLFFHFGKTAAMAAAVHHIQTMNREAVQLQKERAL